MKYLTASPSAIPCRQIIQARSEVRRRQVIVAVDDERGLVERQLADVEAGGGRPKREHGAGGHPPHKRRPTGRIDYGIEVIGLPLDRVGRSVAAIAPTPAVIVDDREPGGEELRHPHEPLPAAIAEGAADDDQRRSLPRAVEGDLGPVFGPNLVDGLRDHRPAAGL